MLTTNVCLIASLSTFNKLLHNYVSRLPFLQHQNLLFSSSSFFQSKIQILNASENLHLYEFPLVILSTQYNSIKTLAQMHTTAPPNLQNLLPKYLLVAHNVHCL